MAGEQEEGRARKSVCIVVSLHPAALEGAMLMKGTQRMYRTEPLGTEGRLIIRSRTAVKKTSNNQYTACSADKKGVVAMSE